MILIQFQLQSLLDQNKQLVIDLINLSFLNHLEKHLHASNEYLNNYVYHSN